MILIRSLTDFEQSNETTERILRSHWTLSIAMALFRQNEECTPERISGYKEELAPASESRSFLGLDLASTSHIGCSKGRSFQIDLGKRKLTFVILLRLIRIFLFQIYYLILIQILVNF